MKQTLRDTWYLYKGYKLIKYHRIIYAMVKIGSVVFWHQTFQVAVIRQRKADKRDCISIIFYVLYILTLPPSSFLSIFIQCLPRAWSCNEYIRHTCSCIFFSLLADVNECEVYRLDQGGKLCVHECVNVPGSYHCSCPSGYKLLPDGRSCEGEWQDGAEDKGSFTGAWLWVWLGRHLQRGIPPVWFTLHDPLGHHT